MEYIDLTTTADSVKYIIPETDYEEDWIRSWNTLASTYTSPFSFSYSFTPTLDWILSCAESRLLNSERDLLNGFHLLSFYRFPDDSLTDEQIVEMTKHLLRIWVNNLVKRSILPANMYVDDFVRTLTDIEGYRQEVYENENGDMCSRYLPNAFAWEEYRKQALTAGVDYQVEAYLDGTPYEMIAANWEVV